MGDTQKVKTNLFLLPETVKGIQSLAEKTHRGKNDVIDWLVSDTIDRLQKVELSKTTVDQALQMTSIPN